MKPVIIKFSDRTELYFYESEEQLNSYIEAFSIADGDWAKVDLEEFPGTENWGNCFQLNSPGVSFNLGKAKESSKEFLDSLYLRKKSLILGDLKETEVLLDLYLPEEDRNPDIKKIAEGLIEVRKQLSDCKSLLEKCKSIGCINNALSSVKDSWSIFDSMPYKML